MSVGTTVDTEFNNLIFSKDDGVLALGKVGGQAGAGKDLEERGGGGGLIADTVDSPSDCVVAIVILGKVKVDNVVGWARATRSASTAELMQIELLKLGARNRAGGADRVSIRSARIVEDREDVVGVYYLQSDHQERRLDGQHVQLSLSEACCRLIGARIQ